MSLRMSLFSLGVIDHLTVSLWSSPEGGRLSFLVMLVISGVLSSSLLRLSLC